MYSVDGMRGKEALSAKRRLAAALAEKWSRPYSQMMHFIKVHMRIAAVRANSLLLRGSRDRGHTRQQIHSGQAVSTLQEGWLD